jgi:8-oxo-dGTP pyrophosphatase MutT (NUDIX family)
MSTNRPEPGAQLHDGPAVAARPAATVMLVRGGFERLEVLLVQRSLAASFMPGAWVFPGGSVDTQDGDGQAGLRNAARRELGEEAGITLPADAELVAFARWITPVAAKRRFDTWFFVAAAPDRMQAQVDGSEIIDSRWFEPGQALSLESHQQLFLVFPTIKQLQQLARFGTAQALMAHARAQDVQPVLPEIIGSGETARIVLPGEPGYTGSQR